MGEVKGLITASDYKECGRCGRKLRDSKSIERGYGRCCWKKHQKEKAKEQFEKRQQQLFDSRSA